MQDTSGQDPDDRTPAGQASTPYQTAASIGRERRRFTLIAVAGLLCLGLVGMFVLKALKTELAPVGQQEKTFTVATTPVVITGNQPTLSVFGEVAAGQEADLRALVQGDVVEAAESFRNGGVVRKGDMLFRIDPFEYEAQVADLKAQIAETRARIAEAEARLSSETLSLVQDREMLMIRDKEASRAANLHKKGNISDKTRDDSMMLLSQQKQTVSRREAAIKSEQARLLQQRAALERHRVSFKRAERDLARTTLTAPFDGFLSQVAAQRGSVLNSNDKVARLVGADTLEVRAHLSDAQYGRLLQDGGLEGRPAQVNWQVGDQTITFDAVIARLTAEIQADSGGVTFYALIDADGLDLPIRPGAFVEVALPDRHFPQSIRLPAQALHDDRRVFVLADDRLVARAVQVLGRDGDDVILRGKLDEGERVVLTRFSEMAPGAKALDPALIEAPKPELDETDEEDSKPGWIKRMLSKLFGSDDAEDQPDEAQAGS